MSDKTPETKDATTDYAPDAVMTRNRDVAKAVLGRLQDDIKKAATDADKNPYEVVYCVWTVLGKVLSQDAGIDAGSLLLTFMATHPEIIAGSFDEGDTMNTGIFKMPGSDAIN